jgi:hypothetical protein
MMTVTPHSLLFFNDQTMLSPGKSTGVILTNSCRLIFEWREFRDEMIHHFSIREEATSISLFLIILSRPSHQFFFFYIVKCVNVSMIYALLSIPNSCLCVDKHIEHLNIIILQSGISFYYSFCSHTNWCFVAKRERSTVRTIIFPLECLKEKVNCLHLAFGYRTRVRLHRLLLSVMSRSTQVVSFFLLPCYYHNMCVCVWNNLRLMHANIHTHQIFCFK